MYSIYYIPIVHTTTVVVNKTVYLINEIDYNLSVVRVFLLNSNIFVLRCIMSTIVFIGMTWHSFIPSVFIGNSRKRRLLN